MSDRFELKTAPKSSMSVTRRITALGMMSAAAYVVYLIVPKVALFPVVPFLNYDAKDVVIVIGGFIFGPLFALLVSVTVAAVEMALGSITGYIGFIMNVLSSCAFACTASFIYSRMKIPHKQKLSLMVIPLLAGVVVMTATMLLWNYIITPFYMNVPRDVVVGLMLKGFLPFNLVKAGINACLAFVLFIPIRNALSRTNLFS